MVSPIFSQNCFIAHLEGRNDCLVVDPGLDPQSILDYLTEQKLTPAVILNTHGHADHIAGNGVMKQHWPEAPLVIGTEDVPKLSDPEANLSANLGLPIVSPPADVVVNEGDILQYAGFQLEVRHIPGHSVGHVVFIWHQATPAVVFGGDVLFAGSVGRTDFPDGSFAVLAKGIRQKLFNLPDDTVVLSGHGPETTTGHEKRTNPFVGLGRNA